MRCGAGFHGLRVCVQLKGWVDLKRLDGVARLEFDYDLADVSVPNVECTSLPTHPIPYLTRNP